MIVDTGIVDESKYEICVRETKVRGSGKLYGVSMSFHLYKFNLILTKICVKNRELLILIARKGRKRFIYIFYKELVKFSRNA